MKMVGQNNSARDVVASNESWSNESREQEFFNQAATGTGERGS
jgi:hypothetical protein